MKNVKLLLNIPANSTYPTQTTSKSHELFLRIQVYSGDKYEVVPVTDAYISLDSYIPI